MPDNNMPARKGRPPKPKEVEGDNIEQAGEQIVKAKRKGNNQKENFGEEYVQKGDNARYLRHAMQTLDLPAIDISDEKQVEERIQWYFTHCVENDMKPTVKGLCNALGINRSTIRTWYNEDYRGTTHSNLIKKAYDLLEELWEDYMLNGKINPVSGIFLGRNNWNYQDKIDIVVTPNNPLGAETDPEKLAQKYKDALPAGIIDAESAESDK